MKLKWMAEDAKIIVSWPVSIEVPADDGAVQVDKVKISFQILEAEVANGLLYPSRDQVLSAMVDGLDADTTVAFLSRVIVGWHEPDFGQGFSPEGLTRLLAYPFARNALFKAYGEAAQGRRAKN
jgi:hypothetical protein